tara:strand:- start:1743 stop:1985 length:243 start_codon:yes stop_codon:yes gene_type:complete
MKIGELYEIRHKWLLPHDNYEFWSNCGPVLYVGETIIDRDDGKEIVNHVVLVHGKRRLLDSTFLRLLAHIDGEESPTGPY